MGFLHQGDSPGQRGIAGPRCIEHGLAPNRLGEHVIPESGQVAIPEGFEVDNGGIDIAQTRRAHRKLGKTLGLNRLLEFIQRLLGDDLAVTEPLNAGVGLRHPQALDKGSPLGSGHYRIGIHQRSAAEQDKLMIQHALVDGFEHFQAERFELLIGRPGLGLAQTGPGQQGDGDRDQQDHPCSAVMPGKHFPEHGA